MAELSTVMQKSRPAPCMIRAGDCPLAGPARMHQWGQIRTGRSRHYHNKRRRCSPRPSTSESTSTSRTLLISVPLYLLCLLCGPNLCEGESSTLFLQAAPVDVDSFARRRTDETLPLLVDEERAVAFARTDQSLNLVEGGAGAGAAIGEEDQSNNNNNNNLPLKSRSRPEAGAAANELEAEGKSRAVGAFSANLQRFAVPHADCEGSMENWYCDGPYASRTVMLDESAQTKVLTIPTNFPAIELTVQSNKAFQLTFSEDLILPDSKFGGSQSSDSPKVSVVHGQKQGSSFQASFTLHGSPHSSFNVNARGEASLASYYFGKASFSSASLTSDGSSSSPVFGPSASSASSSSASSASPQQTLDLLWRIAPCPKAPVGCNSFRHSSTLGSFLPVGMVLSHPGLSILIILLAISVAVAVVVSVGRFFAKPPNPHWSPQKMQAEGSYECIDIDQDVDRLGDDPFVFPGADANKPSVHRSWTGKILGRHPSTEVSLRVMRQAPTESPRAVPPVALPLCSNRESSTFSSEPMSTSYLSQASAYLSPRFHREGCYDISGLPEDLYRCVGLRRAPRAQPAAAVPALSFPFCEEEPTEVVLRSLQKLQSDDRDLRDASKNRRSRKSSRASRPKSLSRGASGLDNSGAGDLQTQALLILEELIKARNDGEGDAEVQKESKDIQEGVCKQLELLCHDPIVRATLIESSEALPVFVEVLADSQQNHVATAHAAMNALTLLMDEEELVNEIYHSDCVPVLLRLISHTQVTDRSLILKAFLLLRELCTHRPLRHQFAKQQLGNPPRKALVFYLEGPLLRFSEDREILVCAIGLLGLLAFEDEHRMQLIEASAAEHLLEIMEKHEDSQAVHLVAMMALAQLSKRSGDRALLNHLRLQDVVRKSCQKFPELSEDEAAIELLRLFDDHLDHSGSKSSQRRGPGPRNYPSITSTHAI